jgi:hypothetical protein
VTISGHQLLQPGLNNFWITYDVASTAPAGNLLDATLASFTLGGVERNPSTTAPTGSRTVVSLSKEAGQALSFTASGQFVDFGTNSNLVLGSQYTQELWMKPSSSMPNGTVPVLGYQPAAGINERSPTISVVNPRKLEVGFGSGTTWNSLTTGNVLTLNEWNHVVVTYDGTTLTVIINGEDEGSATFANRVPSATPVRYLGSLNGTAGEFRGQIDEVSLWSRALSLDEIRERRHLLRTGTEADLMAYWQLNETSGSTADRVSGATGTLSTSSTSSRVSSTAAVGVGTSSRRTAANGVVDFAGTQSLLNFTNVTGSFELVATKLEGRPLGTAPSGVTRTYNRSYWIFDQYSGGSFGSAALTYSGLAPGEISAGDAAAPANLKLLKRGSNSDGAWTITNSGTAANSTSGTVTFGGITSFSQTVIGTTGTSPLPVELVSFVAERQGADALLRWITASEKNNAHFEVQASTDGHTFQTLGKVTGQGTSSQRHEYTFTDARLSRYQASVVYYRLRQVDFDGTANDSPVRAVQLDAAPATAFAVQAWPSPFDSDLSVRVQTGTTGEATFTVFDALGRTVYIEQKQLGAGTSEVPVRFAQTLPAGVYTLSVRQGKQHTLLKMVRQ